jgi:uncharacterized protein YndB with AHSA1/START domain
MKITIQNTIAADKDTVWEHYTNPAHIVHWNAASDDWCCPSAENDLRVGGTYRARMEAKDASAGFDFEATYDAINKGESFTYTMSDGRKVDVLLEGLGDQTRITVTFDAEDENPAELQRAGWQSILDNFKQYVERA